MTGGKPINSMEDGTGYFQSRFLFDPGRDRVWQEICRFLQDKYISKTARILEIGAGYCHFINHISGSERHALDVSSEVLRYAGERVRTHVRSCANLEGIEDGFFDVIFASNVFEHLAREEMLKTLSEIKRVSARGAKLIVMQPNFKYCYKSYFDDYTHVQIFTHVGLSDLLVASGFDIAEVKPRFLPFSMSSKLPKNRWLVRLYLHSPVKPFASQMLIVATP